MKTERRYRMLVTARFDRSALEGLSGRLEGVAYAGFGVRGEKLSEEELGEALQGVDILVSEFEPVSDSVMDHARDLKLIACCRTGPEASVDVEAATRRGIPVLYTPGRNAVSVAEFTVALMIDVARHICEVHHLLKHTEELTEVAYADKAGRRSAVTSEWSLDPEAPFNHFQGPELDGKVLGLVGYGAVGREVAVRARAFGMRVCIFDPYVSDEAARGDGVERLRLEELASTSDFVVMAAKVSEETRGLFSAAQFERMKPQAYFINTARAAIVDYEALYRVLAERRIAGAALDVYPEEPISSKSRFRALENVVLTPHLAGASLDIPRRHSRMVAAALIEAFSGRPPAAMRNPEAWPRSSFAAG